MAPRHRIIIDTDPGVDDVLAILLALSAKPDELEVLLISVTFGNVEVHNCLRNVVTLFHHIALEMKWRKDNGGEEGFETLRETKPLVAIGAHEPLSEHSLMADYFHGIDGLGGIHNSHPHLTPAETWQSLFHSTSESSQGPIPVAKEVQTSQSLFTPSPKPAHEEILNLLRDNEPDTITIVAVGPLTNLATAAAADPETFLRAKEVVVMGGTINETGNVGPLCNPDMPCPPVGLIKAPPSLWRSRLMLRNQITPVAEFNVLADSVAAARVFALTSPNPTSTMPFALVNKIGIQDYPRRLSRPLRLVLFPLDITMTHNLSRSSYDSFISPLIKTKSPLAEWTNAFLTSTFNKLDALYQAGAPLSLHDPLCIWHLLASPPMTLSQDPEDIRVESSGQWTRGMCVIDRRDRTKAPKEQQRALEAEASQQDAELSFDEVPGDTGNWLRADAGNRIWRCVDSPWKKTFGVEMLSRIFTTDALPQP